MRPSFFLWFLFLLLFFDFVINIFFFGLVGLHFSISRMPKSVICVLLQRLLLLLPKTTAFFISCYGIRRRHMHISSMSKIRFYCTSRLSHVFEFIFVFRPSACANSVFFIFVLIVCLFIFPFL